MTGKVREEKRIINIWRILTKGERLIQDSSLNLFQNHNEDCDQVILNPKKLK